MICYKDQTFCRSDCINQECYRYYDSGVAEDALKSGLPIATCDYSKTCDFYLSPKSKETDK